MPIINVAVLALVVLTVGGGCKPRDALAAESAATSLRSDGSGPVARVFDSRLRAPSWGFEASVSARGLLEARGL